MFESSLSLFLLFLAGSSHLLLSICDDGYECMHTYTHKTHDAWMFDDDDDDDDNDDSDDIMMMRGCFRLSLSIGDVSRIWKYGKS
jgi:hypothetical protein